MHVPEYLHFQRVSPFSVLYSVQGVNGEGLDCNARTMKASSFEDTTGHGALPALLFEHAEHKKLLDSPFQGAQIVRAWSPDMLLHRRLT